jgi:hypothetical protein
MKQNIPLSVILFYFCSIILSGQSSENDTINIYQEVAGDYEYYSDLQYYYFNLYTENKALLFKEPNIKGYHIVVLADLANLKFQISDSVKQKFLFFKRNNKGEISSCRLVTNGSENLAYKQNSKADTIPVAEKKYSVEALKADLTQIKDILINNHPAIYQFTSEELFRDIFNEQMNKIIRPMNLREFFLIAAPIVEEVHCGHTRIYLPEKFWNYESRIFFPIILQFIGGKSYVNGFYNRENLLPAGSEILSVNNIPMPEIIKSAKGLISSDGKNEKFKLEMLQQGFPDLYYFVYGYNGHFDTEYILPGSKIVNSRTFNAISREVLREYSMTFTKKTSTGDPNLDFEIISNKNLAVMTIKSFFAPSDKEIFYSYIDKAFEEINKNKIQNLIIDLRSNAGGKSDRTAHLLSYIESKPVTYFARTYTGYEDSDQPVPLATKNSFSGKLLVLINGACFSATSQLCSVLKFNKIGSLIGEETGATFECNSQPAKYNTKETRMTLFVAQMTFSTAVKGMSRENGVMPDYLVEPKIEDLVKGNDTVKDFAFRLIEKSHHVVQN